MTGPRYIISQFDNRTWQVNDRRTNRVYAECGDPEVGGDAKQRAERIARLLNDNTDEIAERVRAAYLLAKITKRRDAKITGAQMMAEIAKREPKRRAAMKGRK